MSYREKFDSRVFGDLVRGGPSAGAFGYSDIASACYNLLKCGGSKITSAIDGESFVNDFLAGVQREHLLRAGVSTGVLPVWRMRVITGKLYGPGEVADPSYLFVNCKGVRGTFSTFECLSDTWTGDEIDDILVLRVLGVLQSGLCKTANLGGNPPMQAIIQGKGFPDSNHVREELHEIIYESCAFSLLQIFPEKGDTPIMAVCDHDNWENPLAGINEPIVEIPGETKWRSDELIFAPGWDAEKVCAYLRGQIPPSGERTPATGVNRVKKMSL